MSRFGSPKTSISSNRAPSSPTSPTSPRLKSSPYHPVLKVSDDSNNFQDFKEVQSLFESYLVQLGNLKVLITSMADCLSAEVTLSSTRAIEKIQKIEQNLKDQIKSAKDCSYTAKKTYFYLSKSLLELPSLETYITKASNTISEAFTFDFLEKFPVPSNIKKEYLVFFNQKSSSFNKLDIEQLVCEKTQSNFSCLFSSGYEISNGIFFLHGGTKHFEASSDTSLFDIYLNKIDKLPSSNYARSGSACIKKDEKIFVFGSSSPVSRYCEKFDLQEFEWKKITQMPKEAVYPTGSVSNGKVLVTAVGLSGFWEFNDVEETYLLIECPVSAGYKAMCDRFIISSNGLFEVSWENEWKVERFEANWVGTPLAISTAFKRKGMIYFVDSNYKLYRIDPDLKKLEEIRYKVNELA